MNLGYQLTKHKKYEFKSQMTRDIEHIAYYLIQIQDFHDAQDIICNILREIKTYVTLHNNVLKEEIDHREYIVQR